MKKLIFALFVAIVSIAFLHSNPTKAAPMNFSVETIMPANQIDKTKTYFDLKMKPNQNQNLKVKLRNNKAMDITVQIKTNPATTNINGIIDYGVTPRKADNTLKYKFNELMYVPHEVKLKAHETKTISLSLKMPKEKYKGIILGGIHFQEAQNKKTAKDDGNVEITNSYAYIVGVSLKETNDRVQPKLQLTSVKAGQVNYKNAFLANIQNPKAKIMKHLKIEGYVYRANNLKKPLYSRKAENLRMAPNSNFDFAIPLNDRNFKKGTYVFKGKATNELGTWYFNKEFKIKGGVEKLNKSSVDQVKDSTFNWLWVVIIVCLLIILFLIFLLVRRKKEEDQVNQKE